MSKISWLKLRNYHYTLNLILSSPSCLALWSANTILLWNTRFISLHLAQSPSPPLWLILLQNSKGSVFNSYYHQKSELFGWSFFVLKSEIRIVLVGVFLFSCLFGVCFKLDCFKLDVSVDFFWIFLLHIRCSIFCPYTVFDFCFH